MHRIGDDHGVGCSDVRSTGLVALGWSRWVGRAGSEPSGYRAVMGTVADGPEITVDMEGRHQPVGGGVGESLVGWSESHRVDVFVERSCLALSFQVIAHRSHAVFLASLLAPEQSPIVIVEHDVPIPGIGWEIRASGLWADHICETPLDHWSYGLEAFALAVDRPDELLGRALGERVPLGWELEFEAGEEAAVLGESAQTISGYRQAGTVHGLVLSADGDRAIDGLAVRSHWWGFGGPTLVTVGAPGSASLDTVLLPDVYGCWHHELTATGSRSRSLPVGVV